jgi:hypothetical protein
MEKFCITAMMLVSVVVRSAAQPGFSGEWDFLNRKTNFEMVIQLLGEPDYKMTNWGHSSFGGSSTYSYFGYAVYKAGYKFWFNEPGRPVQHELLLSELNLTRFDVKRKGTTLKDGLIINRSTRSDVREVWGEPKKKRGFLHRRWSYGYFNLKFSVFGKLKRVRNFF